MKKYILMIITIAATTHAFALTEQDQRAALTQLEIARAEIQTVKNLMPSFALKIVGKNLSNADQRMAFAQQILAMSPVQGRYYCTVQSSFDGNFSGRGTTQLEAKTNALAACRQGSRNNGFFCDEDSTVCQAEN